MESILSPHDESVLGWRVLNSPALSVVVPAFNEAERIGSTLERIVGYYRERDLPFEVLVVDDGSTDATVRVARKAGGVVRVLEQGCNRGKGAAVRRGVFESRGQTILFSDADLSTPIEQWEPMRAILDEGYPIVIGSRALVDSRIEIRQPWYRERMGKTFNWILRRLLPLEIEDTQCGFKLFERAAGRELFGRARVDGFAFDAEILFLAKRLGYRVGELPVPWFDSVPSRVHAIWHSAQMLKDMLRIRLFAATGAYDAPPSHPAENREGGDGELVR